MVNGAYLDLHIVNDDITPDAGGLPLKISERASIAQDIVHMIRECGYLTAMLAERDPRRRRELMVKITIDVDDDQRIRPGTARIEESQPGQLWLTATTVDYGDIGLSLEVQRG